MGSRIFDLVVAAFGGGLFVKILEFLYSEYSKGSNKKEICSKHIDPILKAADELLSKLLSLTKKDFIPLKDAVNTVDKETDKMKQLEIPYVMYLFAHFWSRIAILRKEGIYVDLEKIKEGEILIQFILALEANPNRFISRALQRGIGDALILYHDGGFISMSFYEFFEEYKKDEKSSLRSWLEPFLDVLSKIGDNKVKQQILIYCAILHSLVDTLDPKHKIAKEKPFYLNKLAKQTRQHLKKEVFNTYLSFVKNKEKYC